MSAVALLAQQSTVFFPSGLPWFAWIAIVAIVCGAVSTLVQNLIRHRERMAMIQMGIHPDRPDAVGQATEGKPWVPETSEL